jgi:hypothetical protein
MTTMFVRHTVANYKAWRKVYDDFAPVQKAKGVTAQAVYRRPTTCGAIRISAGHALNDAQFHKV